MNYKGIFSRLAGEAYGRRVAGFAVLLFSGLLWSLSVLAQNADGSAAPGSCPQIAPPDPVLLSEIRELSFKPGIKLEPSDFMKDPRIANFIAEMMTREQLIKQADWAGLCRYREANAKLIKTNIRPEVVFLGDSITENWIYAAPKMFSQQVVDRGIGGQTSSQLLLRFYPDVVALGPKLVHIMAGTNDLLQNAGPIRDDDIVNNIEAMLDIAQANNIKVVLASILPISVRSWQPALQPAQRIIKLNARLKGIATARGIGFVDYFSVLKSKNNGLNADLGNDGVHPNRAGYALMEPLAIGAIKGALPSRPR